MRVEIGNWSKVADRLARAERAKADNDQDRASLKRLDELMPELDKLDAALKVEEGLDR